MEILLYGYPNCETSKSADVSLKLDMNIKEYSIPF